MVEHLIDFESDKSQEPICHIVMPLYHGSLWDMLPLPDILTMERAMAQIIQALLFMHGSRVLHRDVKPENILIKRKNPIHIALCDLGWAATLQDRLLLRKACGTPGFAAPEIPSNVDQVSNVVQTAAIDVFSLGITFYFMLHPERRTWEILSAVSYNVMKRPPKLYAGLILSMLACNPDERPSLQECLDVVNKTPIVREAAAPAWLPPPTNPLAQPSSGLIHTRPADHANYDATPPAPKWSTAMTPSANDQSNYVVASQVFTGLS